MCSCVRFEGINTNMFRFIFTLILWTLTVAEEENGIQCKIPNIEHGQYKTADGLVKFSCNPGYVLNGTRISQCHYIGWYPSPPICQEFECGTPPETTYGVYLPKKNSYKIGENVTYICNRSYTIYGDETVTCTAQGWSSLPSCEKKKCPPPPRELPNSEIIDYSVDYYHLDSIQYNCKPNYELKGSAVVTCRNEKWTPLPMCMSESLECEEPPHINHGEIVEIKLAPHVNEEIVMYQCSEKYKLQGNPKAVCLNGKWSNIPTCVAESLECEELPRIRHGDIIEMILPPYKNGLTITVQCSKNYKLQGNSKIQCLDGIWTTLPKCLEPCTVTVDIMEKNKIKLRWTDTRKIYVEHNDVLEFECKQGFTAAQGTAMRASCKDGSFNYPFCI
ncbi:coagulation factor XIII B chain-like isoform X2 [Protopterus annectens]|uniref:coagulation factor XIII B chain-like isoform X2 n=1 Tax=Protopterus annectens TaxID=7888 RepID=UPI001CF9FCF5|nr:coagulation factor XIII B chain-like isoform X2 [Protopterus annectens]